MPWLPSCEASKLCLWGMCLRGPSRAGESEPAVMTSGDFSHKSLMLKICPEFTRACRMLGWLSSWISGSAHCSVLPRDCVLLPGQLGANTVIRCQPFTHGRCRFVKYHQKFTAPCEC